MRYKNYSFDVRPTKGAYIINNWLNGSYQSFEKSMEFLQDQIDTALKKATEYNPPIKGDTSPSYAEDLRSN